MSALSFVEIFELALQLCYVLGMNIYQSIKQKGKKKNSAQSQSENKEAEDVQPPPTIDDNFF
jgi:hypothetical protein